MATPRDIDTLLKGWDFQPGEVNARFFKSRTGRELVQMRVDMGLLQMEADLRPDGVHPHGAARKYQGKCDVVRLGWVRMGRAGTWENG